MRLNRTTFVMALPLLAALGLAACGVTSSSGNNAGAGGIYGSTPSSSTTAPTATSAPTTAASGLPIKTATVMVSGASKMVLTNAQGLTLYYNTSDTATSVFSGSAWPPLLSPSGAPTSSTTLPGKLGVLNDANGTQAMYNGHPLYTFAGDSAAGQATGDGIGGIWFVATPSLAKASSPAPGATATPGKCYGAYCP